MKDEIETYRIQVRNSDGDKEAQEISGTICGPFGVAVFPTSGFYRVTHLHSGLKVREIGSSFRDEALSAARELAEVMPFWRSHSPERIARENGYSQKEAADLIRSIAIAHGCDGDKDSEDWKV